MINTIGTIALESILFEVSATPKPGLVDRNNCGAHHDMDFFTFMLSASALHNCFEEFARIGVIHSGEPPSTILPLLRRSGIAAEKKMFAATNGVNTHKGVIFSMGILCGCAGWLVGQVPLSINNICHAARSLCKDLCKNDYKHLSQKSTLTKGEQIYMKYGITGARGEAESGFATVREVSVPIYKSLLAQGCLQNDALVHTLISLFAHNIDTNVIARHDIETSNYVQEYAKKALNLGGINTEEGRICLSQMDEDFIKRNISPGGSADLLAVTHFLVALESHDSAVREDES